MSDVDICTGGAWLVAYNEEKNRRFEAVLGPNSVGASDRKRLPKNIGGYREKSHLKCTELNGIFLVSTILLC